jgi:hypothetical protein
VRFFQAPAARLVTGYHMPVVVASVFFAIGASLALMPNAGSKMVAKRL